MSKKEAEKDLLTKRQKRYLIFKYTMDRILACLGLILLSPLFIVLYLSIKIEDGWKAPVFFQQKRIGENKKHFMLYKFRSMKLDTPHDTPTHLLENPEQYITKVGKILRKTSLDELPQLLNILKGELSAVGPRPALWNQYDLIEERDKYGVHQIKPGLTGWAQINGRDELEIPAKARLDGEYLEHIGLSMDLKCFFGTFKSVAMSEGVVEGGTGTINGKAFDSMEERQLTRELVAEEEKTAEKNWDRELMAEERDNPQIKEQVAG